MAERFIIDGNFTQSFVGTLQLNANACPAGTDLENKASLFYDVNTGVVCYQTSSNDFCFEYVFDASSTITSRDGSFNGSGNSTNGKFQFLTTQSGFENFPTSSVDQTFFVVFNAFSNNSGLLQNYLLQNAGTGSIKLSTTTQTVEFKYGSSSQTGSQVILGATQLTASVSCSSLSTLVKTTDTPFLNGEVVCLEIGSLSDTGFPFTGSAQITGSLTIEGDTTINGNLSASTFFIDRSTKNEFFPLLFASGNQSSDDQQAIQRDFGDGIAYKPLGNELKLGQNSSAGFFHLTGSMRMTSSTDEGIPILHLIDGQVTASSYTGSFVGDGSGLTGVGAGFPFTGSAAISGSLSMEGEEGHISASGNISSSKTSSGMFGFFASGSNIGPAEDLDYTDGLYTDFTSDTLVGVAIDKFNETLKALAPSPAPILSTLGDNETIFQDCEISFGASHNSIAGVTNVTALGTLAALPVSGTFDARSSGDNSGSQGDYRLGLNNSITAQDITGELNRAVAQDGGNGNAVNFSASAFGDATAGKLLLFANSTPGESTPIAEVNLESSNNAIETDNSNGTLTVSSTQSATFPGGTSFTGFIHRSGSYKVKTASQRNGMNFVQVIHSSSTFERSTNFIQWLNATQSSADVNFTADIGDFTGTPSSVSDYKYLSGVRYHTGGHITYSGSATNFYKIVNNNDSDTVKVEINGPTNFFEVNRLFLSGSDTKVGTGTTSNKSLSPPEPEQIANTHLFPLALTASISGGLAKGNYYSLIVDNNDTTEDLVIRTDLDILPSGKISDGTNIGSKSVKGLLLDARTIPNNASLQTLQSESFVSESYRLQTNVSYTTQAQVTDSNNAWAPQSNILTSTGTGNAGLLVMPRWTSGGTETNGAGMLVYPDSSTVPESGDFSSFTNGAAGNPDYSGASGDLTYIRYFRNVSGDALPQFTLFITSWSSTIDVNDVDDSIGANDIHLEVKLPGDTGYLDLGTTTAQASDDDLTADGTAGRLGAKPTISTSPTGFLVSTKNTVSGNTVDNNDYVVVRITATHGFIRAIKSIGITDFI